MAMLDGGARCGWSTKNCSLDSFYSVFIKNQPAISLLSCLHLARAVGDLSRVTQRINRLKNATPHGTASSLWIDESLTADTLSLFREDLGLNLSTCIPKCCIRFGTSSTLT